MARTSAARKPADDPTPAETGAAPSSESETAAELEARELIADSQNANPKPPKSAVYRATESGQRLWLGEFTTDLVNPEFVARRFGGGKFYIQHKTAEPGGGYKYAAHDTYDIDPSIKPEPLTTVERGGGEGAPVVAARPSRASTIESIMDAGVLQLLNQMNAQNELTLAMVKRLATDERRGPDWSALLVAALPLVLELVKNRKDPTDVAIQLAKVMKPDAPAAANTADSLATLERLLTLSRKIGGAGAGDAGEGSVMPVVAEGMRTLGTLVQGIVNERTLKAEAAARAAGVPGTGAPAEPHHAPLALVPDIPEPSPTDMATSSTPARRPWMAAVGDRLPLLLGAAKFLSANAAAETISRNLTDDAFFDLLEDIHDATPPGFAGRLVAAFPAAESLPAEWFEQVVQLLVAEAETDDAGETPAPAAGAARDGSAQ